MTERSRVIISAANAPFYPLLAEAVASVRDKREGAHVPYVVFDLGLTREQRAALARRSVQLITPGWDYAFSQTPPEWFKAMTARTCLPKWVPGYNLYFWLDADAWVQRWQAVEDICAGAERYGFAVVAEADRAYTDIESFGPDRAEIVSVDERERKLRAYFGERAVKLRKFPCLNCGVFAARADSDIWQAWPKLMHTALHNNPGDTFFAEQTAMNVALLSGAVRFTRLPATHNWLLTSARPKVGTNNELVHPEFPHEPLGIIHRTANTKSMNVSLPAVDGSATSVGFGYPGPAV